MAEQQGQIRVATAAGQVTAAPGVAVVAVTGWQADAGYADVLPNRGVVLGRGASRRIIGGGAPRRILNGVPSTARQEIVLGGTR